MTEISLNVLDIAQNSVAAGATLITVNVEIHTPLDSLKIIVRDNGRGMSREELKNASDPFFTTRTTRKIGLGIPFFKMGAESSGGSFEMNSEEGKGTEIKADFKISHIDRMPLGDINSTVYTLIAYNPEIDFMYTYAYDERCFTLDTRQFKEVLGEVNLNAPEVLEYLKEYLYENKTEVDGDLTV